MRFSSIQWGEYSNYKDIFVLKGEYNFPTYSWVCTLYHHLAQFCNSSFRPTGWHLNKNVNLCPERQGSKPICSNCYLIRSRPTGLIGAGKASVHLQLMILFESAAPNPSFFLPHSKWKVSIVTFQQQLNHRAALWSESSHQQTFLKAVQQLLIDQSCWFLQLSNQTPHSRVDDQGENTKQKTNLPWWESAQIIGVVYVVNSNQPKQAAQYLIFMMDNDC